VYGDETSGSVKTRNFSTTLCLQVGSYVYVLEQFVSFRFQRSGV
jgi:hypothetical protein